VRTCACACSEVYVHVCVLCGVPPSPLALSDHLGECRCDGPVGGVGKGRGAGREELLHDHADQEAARDGDDESGAGAAELGPRLVGSEGEHDVVGLGERRARGGDGDAEAAEDRGHAVEVVDAAAVVKVEFVFQDGLDLVKPHHRDDRRQCADEHGAERLHGEVGGLRWKREPVEYNRYSTGKSGIAAVEYGSVCGIHSDPRGIAMLFHG